jgi:Peptidase family M3
MALKDRDDVTFSSENLSKTHTELESYLSNPETLQQAQDYKAQLPDDAPLDLLKTLEIIIRTGSCHDMSKAPESQAIREQALKLEAEMTMKRNRMTLGYTDPTIATKTTTTEEGGGAGSFKELSSVGLRNVMRVSPDESIRKAAYHEGLRAIGPFVCANGFPELVKLRNQFAKSLGYIDFYDYKVTNAEGFGKERLFTILDGLEVATRPLMEQARQELERRHGKAALDPWNTAFLMSGDVIKKMVRNQEREFKRRVAYMSCCMVVEPMTMPTTMEVTWEHDAYAKGVPSSALLLHTRLLTFSSPYPFFFPDRTHISHLPRRLSDTCALMLL